MDCVSVSVGHNQEPYRSGKTDQGAVLAAESERPKKSRLVGT